MFIYEVWHDYLAFEVNVLNVRYIGKNEQSSQLTRDQGKYISIQRLRFQLIFYQKAIKNALKTSASFCFVFSVSKGFLFTKQQRSE